MQNGDLNIFGYDRMKTKTYYILSWDNFAPNLQHLDPVKGIHCQIW